MYISYIVPTIIVNNNVYIIIHYIIIYNKANVDDLIGIVIRY